MLLFFLIQPFYESPKKADFLLFSSGSYTAALNNIQQEDGPSTFESLTLVNPRGTLTSCS
jgi:hypothetical protein